MNRALIGGRLAVVFVFVGRLDIVRLSVAGRLPVGRLVIVSFHLVVAPVGLGVLVVVSVGLLGVVQSWRRFVVIVRLLRVLVVVPIRLSIAGRLVVGRLLIVGFHAGSRYSDGQVPLAADYPEVGYRMEAD